MKNIFIKTILTCFVILCAIGCQDDLESLYQDPDGFSKEQANQSGVSIIGGYFASQMSISHLFGGEYGPHYHNLRSGSRVMGTGIQLYYTVADYGISYTLRDVENDWGSNSFNRSVFNFVNSKWIKQVLWAQKEYNIIAEEDRKEIDTFFIRLLHVLKAYVYQRGIDLYDEVPYFETGSAGALEDDIAEFIGQKDIYPKIIEELKEIESYLETVELSSAEQSLFTQQDLLFQGNIMQWRKFINSLRLRWAITISERMPELTASVLTELQGKPLFDSYNDLAGIADIDILSPDLLGTNQGIGRAFRERSDEARAPVRFLEDVMNCIPTEKTAIVNGEVLYYFDGDNSEQGLMDGTVDPRVAYLFSKDILGRYVGAENGWDTGNDVNSHFSKAMRAYYINDPIMTDINVTSITFGAEGNEHTINLNEEAKADLSKREAYLLSAFRKYCSQYNDISWLVGQDKNMISEYNIRPQFNYAERYPAVHAVEVELLLAEAAVRGFGPVAGSASEHYEKAIQMSCDYWYEMNAGNPYTQGGIPSLPSTMDPGRIDRDKPSTQYNASAYAANAAIKFNAMSDQEKVKAIFEQLWLHYNLFNFEVPYTSARRLVSYLGDNPAEPYEMFQWKERFLYNPSIQATDPVNWAKISQHDDPNLPIWFTNRTTKWKNTLE